MEVPKSCMTCIKLFSLHTLKYIKILITCTMESPSLTTYSFCMYKMHNSCLNQSFGRGGCFNIRKFSMWNVDEGLKIWKVMSDLWPTLSSANLPQISFSSCRWRFGFKTAATKWNDRRKIKVLSRPLPSNRVCAALPPCRRFWRLALATTCRAIPSGFTPPLPPACSRSPLTFTPTLPLPTGTMLHTTTPTVLHRRRMVRRGLRWAPKLLHRPLRLAWPTLLPAGDPHLVSVRTVSANRISGRTWDGVAEFDRAVHDLTFQRWRRAPG